MSVVWRIRLADSAEMDLLDIADWTRDNFGPRQAMIYTETITLAITALHNGPDVLGSKPRDEIETGIRTLHVARQGRSGRHFVVFREAPSQIIDVLRILHDSMDLGRHLVSPKNEPH